jgi:hypothetical protein
MVLINTGAFATDMPASDKLELADRRPIELANKIFRVAVGVIRFLRALPL